MNWDEMWVQVLAGLISGLAVAALPMIRNLTGWKRPRSESKKDERIGEGTSISVAKSRDVKISVDDRRTYDARTIITNIDNSRQNVASTHTSDDQWGLVILCALGAIFVAVLFVWFFRTLQWAAWGISLGLGISVIITAIRGTRTSGSWSRSSVIALSSSILAIAVAIVVWQGVFSTSRAAVGLGTVEVKSPTFTSFSKEEFLRAADSFSAQIEVLATSSLGFPGGIFFIVLMLLGVTASFCTPPCVVPECRKLGTLSPFCRKRIVQRITLESDPSIRKPSHS
jgi:hypothetical protein